MKRIVLCLIITAICFSLSSCVSTDSDHFYAEYDSKALDDFLSHYDLSDIRSYLDKRYSMTDVYDYEEIKDEAIGMGWVDDWYDEIH